jgi:oligopeptide transport system substrate-binding protein
MFRAVPKEVIAQYGDRWTDTGNIVTNGPFVVDLFYQTKAVYLRNPLYPKDVNDDHGGNVERVNMLVIGLDALVDLYKADQIDTAPIPGYQVDRVTEDAGLSTQILTRKSMIVFYFGFMYDKPPFDKVGVRRAFSAVIDRKAFAAQFNGTPIAHLMPPGIHGAVPIDEVGIGTADNPGFDPEYAKQQFAEAGYPDCKGFPQVNILTFDADWARLLQNAVSQYLGCPPGLINIREQFNFSTLLRTIKPTSRTDVRPHIFTLGWGPDYPDAQNWMHDVLSCNAENDFKRPCVDAIDGKIDAASREPNDTKRMQMYRELEESFFGKDGQFPMAPLFVANDLSLVKPWYTGPLDTDGLYSGAHWNTYNIDQEAQLAARGGETGSKQ